MLIGGTENLENSISSKTLIVDVEKNKWTIGPELLTGRREHSCSRMKTTE